MGYRDKLKERIELINQYRKIPSIGSWEKDVERVVVILSSSRAGSTLFKGVLSQSKDILSLSGEEAPYYIITGNGFNLSSESDAFFPPLKKRRQVLDNFFFDLGTPKKDSFSPSEYFERWLRRLPLQDFRSSKRISNKEETYFFKFNNLNQANTYFLSQVVPNRKWGLWDFLDVEGEFNPNSIKIEETPFIVPVPKKPPTLNDFRDKILLFKTSPNVYRPGLFEFFFPKARIYYIHLARDVRATVNGLMDGWLYKQGFFSHNISDEVSLAIEGYSDVMPKWNDWWNFDLPPNWKSFIDAPLMEVCLNQWRSANRSIMENFDPSMLVHFEDFLSDTERILQRISNKLEIDGFSTKELPILMATKKPAPQRWKKDRPELDDLIEQKGIKRLMRKLGY